MQSLEISTMPPPVTHVEINHCEVGLSNYSMQTRALGEKADATQTYPSLSDLREITSITSPLRKPSSPARLKNGRNQQERSSNSNSVKLRKNEQ